MIWHSESIDNILKELDVSRSGGLTEAQAEARTARYGANVPPIQRVHRLWSCIKAAFHNPGVGAMFAVAIGIIGVSVYRSTKGYPTDWGMTAVLTAVAVIYTAVTALIRYIAERRLARVCVPVSCKAKVLRDGTWYATTADRLVPGDIIKVREGDLVPADCRILDSYSLLCDESSLTGDTIPASKAAGDTLSHLVPLKKRTNMLYAGCMIALGSAEAVVVETAGNTERNRHQVLALEDRQYLPHQKALSHVGKSVTSVATVLCLAILAISVVAQTQFGELQWGDMLLSAAALLIAAAAVGLGVPSLVAQTAAIKRLKRHGVQVQQLPALEKAGQVSAIVLDSFSALTDNNFTVKKMYTGEEVHSAPQRKADPAVTALVQLAVLCTRDPEEEDPIDKALLRYAGQIGMHSNNMQTDMPRLGEIPAYGGRRCMTAIHLISGKNVAILRGDPAEVLPCCTGIDLPTVQAAVQKMETEGERVTAVAYRYLDTVSPNPLADEVEHDMIFVGLLGLADKTRTRAQHALFECLDAGIRTLLITGDSLTMATASAISLGLIEKPNEVIDGHTLETMSDEQLIELLPQITVVSRPSTVDRARLIKALKAGGATVLMTGDDARDVVAMAEADISAAMGNSDDVARIASDIIIPDGRFETLAYAIRTGRGVITSIRKAVGFRIAATAGILLTQFLGLLFGGCLILSPMLLLITAMLTDLLLVPALAHERAERREMRLKPRTAHTAVFHPLWLLRGLLQGAVLAAGPAIVFAAVGVHSGDWLYTAVSTAAFSFLLMLATQAFTFRYSPLPSLFGGFNFFIVIAMGAVAALAGGLCVSPELAELCGMPALGEYWAVVVWVPALLLVFTEVVKTFATLAFGSPKGSKKAAEAEAEAEVEAVAEDKSEAETETDTVSEEAEN